jgi:S-formylglutathione hydrolase FrmB
MKPLKLFKTIFFLHVILLMNLSLFSQTEDRSGTAIADISGSLKIRFSYTDNVSQIPINGRILVGFQKDLKKSVNPDFFDPQPTFAMNAKAWKPGETVVMDRSNSVKQKNDLDEMNGWYAVQAIMVTSHNTRLLTNGIFKAKDIALTNKNIVYLDKGKMCMPLDLLFDRTPAPPVFKETETVKEVRIKSELLTAFYGEKDSLLAAVILPLSYYMDKDRVYPTVYVFGGWGASIYSGLGFQQKRYGMSGYGSEKIFVYVNHECRSGFHNFCSSETNGPREETFFRELLPYIEKEYRVNKDPGTRFLMGQSSGAWAALWLLVNYPDQFGGAYAGSPDPVDFTEFIGTNIYEKDANMYLRKDGTEKRLANLKLNPADSMDKGLAVKALVDLDRLAGWGEQMYSFDATFSKRGPDGEPLHLFNWETGAVDPSVAVSWGKYDLSKRISRLNKNQKQSLQSKIHIYVNDQDLFGLNEPVKGFHDKLAKENIDADIRIMHALGHDIWTDDIRKDIHNNMDSVIKVVAH